MNVAHLVYWIFFIAIFGVLPPLSQIQNFFTMCYSLIIIFISLGFILLKLKFEFYDIFIHFQKLVENQHSSYIKILQNDGGAEFTSNHFKAHLSTLGIHHQLSCPYTPTQNGRVERKNWHVTKTGLALLFHTHISPRFRVDTFSAAAYIINCWPIALLGGMSPFQLLYGSSPNYENFHPFGCHVYPYLRDYMSHKFSSCSIPCNIQSFS